MAELDDPSTWPQRLLICIPVAEVGYTALLMSLDDADAGVEGYGWHVSHKRVKVEPGGYIHANHNKLAQWALKQSEWNRAVFLEHDHQFPKDMLYRHACYVEPIVSATYVLRDPRMPLPVFYNWDAGRANALHPSVERVKHMLDNPGLHEVDVVPMGCTSVRREVFETWPKDQPMFNSFTNPRGNTMSDDVWFCRMAQDNGWQPYVDTSLQVDHLTLFPLNVRAFVSWWNNIGSKEAEVRAKEEGAA